MAARMYVLLWFRLGFSRLPVCRPAAPACVAGCSPAPAAPQA